MSENFELGVIAQDIAEHLGDGWEATVNPEASWRVELAGPEAVLSARMEKGRVQISGVYPRLYDRHYMVWSSDHAPTITCALTRGGKAIAADIERRLLDEYRSLRKRVIGRIENAKQRNEQTRATYERILAVLPADTQTSLADGGEYHSFTLFPRGPIHKIQVQAADSIDIEIRSAPEHVAEAICRAIEELIE